MYYAASFVDRLHKRCCLGVVYTMTMAFIIKARRMRTKVTVLTLCVYVCVCVCICSCVCLQTAGAIIGFLQAIAHYNRHFAEFSRFSTYSFV